MLGAMNGEELAEHKRMAGDSESGNEPKWPIRKKKYCNKLHILINNK